MDLATTLLFYLLAGMGVGIAGWLTADRTQITESAIRGMLACLFWPIYLPLLIGSISGPTAETDFSMETSSDDSRVSPDDRMAQAIAQVESELQTALDSLDGWSDDILSHERGRISELRSAWKSQAERIRQLDALLLDPGFTDDEKQNDSDADETAAADFEFVDGSATAGIGRTENIRRLRSLRSQLHRDLMGTLSWVRELVTMIHLARFSGAPASRAEELVVQIAAAVEGLSEVNAWRDTAEAARRNCADADGNSAPTASESNVELQPV